MAKTKTKTFPVQLTTVVCPVHAGEWEVATDGLSVTALYCSAYNGNASCDATVTGDVVDPDAEE